MLYAMTSVACGAEVHGPNAPTAGPPPYRIYRVTPIRRSVSQATMGCSGSTPMICQSQPAGTSALTETANTQTLPRTSTLVPHWTQSAQGRTRASVDVKRSSPRL